MKDKLKPLYNIDFTLPENEDADIRLPKCITEIVCKQLLYIGINFFKINNNKLSEADKKAVNGYLTLASVLLNTDFLKGYSKIGNGWDQYILESKSVTGNTVLTTIPEIKFDSKPIKMIMVKYRGSEKGNANSNVLVKVVTNRNASGDEYSEPTAFYDDRESFHYNFFGLPLNYPVVVSSLSVTLTCASGASANIDDAVVLIVYE
jgi:hypothetical protein